MYFDISIVAEVFVSGSPPNQPIFLSENNKFHYLLILMIDGLFFYMHVKASILNAIPWEFWVCPWERFLDSFLLPQINLKIINIYIIFHRKSINEMKYIT